MFSGSAILLYVTIFFIGTIFGSFFNLCIYRIPRKISIAFPRSHCLSCGHALGALDLIPIISFIMLCGKCRYCKAKISIGCLLTEIFTGTSYVILYYLYGCTNNLLLYSILLSMLIVITPIDVITYTIPDGIVLFGVLLALLLNILSVGIGFSRSFYGLCCGIGALVFINILSLLLLKKQGIGGGDIKLMGMAGMYLGWEKTLLALMLSIYIGGVVGILLIVLKKKRKDDYISFAPILSIGIIITMFFGNRIVYEYVKFFW